MVGAMFTHLRCLRRMSDDEGWIRTLLEEAENERMHLMTFVHIAQPTLFERLVILVVQWLFYLGFSALYLLSARTAHRVVGYFEEEAVISYTHYLAEIDAGRHPNGPAPAIARHYWQLPETATLRDVGAREVLVKEKPIDMNSCMSCHDEHKASTECNFCHNPA